MHELVTDVMPAYREVMTTGGYIIATMVATVGTITVAKINSVSKRVEKTVKQTEATGNGFSEDTRASLEAIREHLANQDAQTLNRNRIMDRILVKFDDRLTHIEDKLPGGDQ